MNSDDYEILSELYDVDPVLTIITRRVKDKRTELFTEHLKYIEKQSLKNFQQIFIVDKVGQGMLAANTSLQLATEHIKSNYVYLLDDDDLLVDKDFVIRIRSIIELKKPDIIFVKAFIETSHPDKIFPHTNCWRKWPKDDKKLRGHIGGGCFIVTKELYEKYIHHFALSSFGDWNFITNIMKDDSLNVYWLDKIVVESKPNRGII